MRHLALWDGPRVRLAPVRLPAVLLAVLALSGSGAALAQEAKNPTLRDELLERGKASAELQRKARNGINKLTALLYAQDGDTPETRKGIEKAREDWQKKVDAQAAEDVAWLRKTLTATGWPANSSVGVSAAGVAFRIAQRGHLRFQKECLALVEKLPRGEYEPAPYALLADAVALAEGKAQAYGMILTGRGDKSLPYGPHVLAEIDRRRKAIGLPPFKEHLADGAPDFVWRDAAVAPKAP